MTTKTDYAVATPAKDFFVSMLTRDISLADAILDLVDNSLDGALRTAKGNPDYSSFSVDVNLDSIEFSITDNCGGISREIAKTCAFKMGRDLTDGRDEDVETIGMYGIGLKRAMFKMGRECRVITFASPKDHYQVQLGRKWLESRQWNKLPLEKVPAKERLAERGTRVVVRDLHPGISSSFVEASFNSDLRKGLSEHFSRFIKHGFQIRLNGLKVEPVRIEMLYSKKGVKPYFWKGTVGETEITVAMGLNPRAKSLGGLSLALPGWSIFCNDRAVVVGDTGRLTGWGDAPVPRYHEQYDILTGVVEFKATSAKGLPVTTTKRDLDATSDAWLLARSVMRKATRMLVTHTNRWKNDRPKHRAHFAAARSLQMEEISQEFETEEGSKLLNLERGTLFRKFDPEKELPKPRVKKTNECSISFKRPKAKVERLAEALLDDTQASSEDVGSASFDFAYSELVDTRR